MMIRCWGPKKCSEVTWLTGDLCTRDEVVLVTGSQLQNVVILGKIDLVKSKIGLGFTACITVVAGLTMSLGICTFFGLSISLSGR